MKKINIENYKDKKEKYDQEILSLDNKIVELEVKKYNLKNQIGEETHIQKINDTIKKYETEKDNLTTTIWKIISDFKIEARQVIDKKLKQNLYDETAITALFLLNKITDIYFDINELEKINNLINTIETNNKTEDKNPGNSSNVVNIVNVKNKIFDIKEQRVIDFENILNLIKSLSEDYRRDISSALDRFLNNYEVVKNAEYLKIDFDNITNNYMEIYKSTISNFRKNENIMEIDNRLKNIIDNQKDTKGKIELYNRNIEYMENQIRDLQDIYFVNNYAKKILNELSKKQEEEIKNVNENLLEDTYEKIKKLTYNKRLEHIIEVSNWTKCLEEFLNRYRLDESDFQLVIYLARQTENICNSNFEQIANLIIELSDKTIILENEETKISNDENILNNKEDINHILKEGIENIKKKYSKIPFIGRRVMDVLNNKMLNS